jgi:hypothetical protein
VPERLADACRERIVSKGEEVFGDALLFGATIQGYTETLTGPVDACAVS